MNIIDYVKTYGDDSFKERPFCTTDAFVFGCLAFVKFELINFVPSYKEPDKKSFLRDIPDEPIYKMTENEMYGPGTNELLTIIRSKKRYQDIALKYEFRVSDNLLKEQIYAITLEIPDAGHFVLFRGTDGTKIGWIENLSALINKVSASQLDAVEYLNIVHNLIGDTPFRIGGHSKGGALSLYASIYVDKNIQDLITNVYDFEGPGLPEKFFEKEEYKRIKDRVVSIVPRDSFIGEFFYTPKNPLVVSCYGHGSIQHDQFHWKTKGTDLYYIKKRNPKGRIIHRASKLWLKKGNKKDFEKLIKVFIIVTYDSTKDDFISLKITFKKAIGRFKEIKEEMNFFQRLHFYFFVLGLYRTYKNSEKYYKKKDKKK